jgi:SAM-dependent methyltransferase
MMLEKLVPYLVRPALYKRTTEPFWDDSHISKGMLEAHLNPETDAASRNPAFIDRSVAWISASIPPSARMLDLGCGPGLYTSRFAERGFDVTGMDVSGRSIAYARGHDSSGKYILQDYLQLSDVASWDVVTLIWCDFGALVPTEWQELLQRVRRALRPGGIFLLDVFTPAHIAGRTESKIWNVEESGGFWSPEPYLYLGAEYLYDYSVTADRHVIVQDGGIRAWSIWNTCFTPDTLANELGAADLPVQAIYADVAGAPYEEGSATICAIAIAPSG